jgi:hypothetical protein
MKVRCVAELPTNLLDESKHEEEESLTGTVYVKSKDLLAYLLYIGRPT